MDNSEKRIVNGFEYESDDEAEKAANELSGIEFVRGKTDMSNPMLVLNVYNKMIERNLFKTLNGYTYLKQLQDFLYQSPEIYDEEIRPIKAPALHPGKRGVKTESVYKSRFINAMIVIALLSVVIVAMFVITTNSKNINILNYKARLETMYGEKEDELAASWSALREKESEVKAREAKVDEMESKFNDGQ